MCSDAPSDLQSAVYLLLVWQLVPHAGKQPGELAVRQVRPLLLQLGTLLLREDEHG